MPYDKEKYKQSKHDRIKLKADGRYYLPGRIKWFIKRDDPVECGQFLTVPFSRNVDYKHPGILHHDIIRFDGKPEDRPDKFDGDSKKLVCKVWCNLAPTLEETKMQSVHKHYRHEFALVRWGEYLNVSYNIRVGIDSSGLRFQLLLNGQTDGSFEGIEVKWTKVVNALVARARSDVSSSISEVESEGD